MHDPAPADDYWRRTRRLTVALLLAWFVVAFVPVVFARELSIEVFGWPLAFWWASQGALLGFCVIVIVYAWRMGQLDDQAPPFESPAGPPPVAPSVRPPETH